MRKKNLNTASWVYLAGLIIIFGIVFWYAGASIGTYLLMFVPTILAFLLVDRRGVLTISLLSSGFTCVLLALQTTLVTAVGAVFAPFLFSLLLAGINYINAGNVLELLYWVTDIQQKDTRRAEEFYQQKEQLSETLMQLTHANSRLALLNVKLAEAQQKTEQASMAKSTFLSNMSHELRTPLNVIIGYTSTMLDMPAMYHNISLPAPYQFDVSVIKENGFYLLGLINDILDLSKIEAGKLELHCISVDLSEVFKGVLATTIGLVKDKPVQIRPDYEKDLPHIWADPIRIRQILLNLMSNAIKFTQTGSVTLQACFEEQQQCVRIAVIDTGIGIPQKALEHIFDRFEQAEHDTDKNYGGTGLGLDISKQLVGMHGGDLSVQSVVGQGSTFFFTMPILTPQQANVAADVLTPKPVLLPDSATDEDMLKSVIMLIEDETGTRERMRHILEGVNYVIIDVQDDDKALKTAIALLPDLIILDIYLPNIDGWQLLEYLKSDPETATIPILVCTASSDEARIKALGAERYLQKPFSSEDLLSSVQTLLPTPLAADSGN